jgi:hypothetical protein
MFLINFLYTYNLGIPTWLFCILAVALSVFMGSLGLVLFRKLFPTSLNKANNDCISLSLSTVGLFSSVLISLIVINVWSFYNDVNQKVNVEARNVEDFYHLTQAMPEPIKSKLITNIGQYIDVVVNEEWPAMKTNQQVSNKGRLILLDTKNILLSYKTTDLIMANTEQALYSKVSDLFDARRDRLIATKDRVPDVIWLVMFLSAFLTIVVSYLYTAESFSMHLISTGFITATLSASLFLIVIFGHPFQGNMRIEPTGLIEFRDQNLKPFVDQNIK